MIVKTINNMLRCAFLNEKKKGTSHKYIKDIYLLF